MYAFNTQEFFLDQIPGNSELWLVVQREILVAAALAEFVRD